MPPDRVFQQSEDPIDPLRSSQVLLIAS
jgi:hypothetical protein